MLFNYVFGGVIGAGTGLGYLQFLVPGVLVITPTVSRIHPRRSLGSSSVSNSGVTTAIAATDPIPKTHTTVNAMLFVRGCTDNNVKMSGLQGVAAELRLGGPLVS